MSNNLKVINIELTQNCPLNCKQCYKSSTNKYMEFSEVVKIGESIRYTDWNQVNLSGGEVMLHKNIIEIIDYFCCIGKKIKIVTSGYGLNDTIIEALSRNRNHVTLVISLNSVDKKTNSELRDGYNFAISAINKCVINKIPFNINCVVYNNNISNLEQLILFAKEKGVNKVSLLKYKMVNDAINTKRLSKIDYIKLLKLIEKYKDVIAIQSCWIELMNMLSVNNDMGIRNGCIAAKSYFNITTNGEITGCPQLREIIPKEEFKKVINLNTPGLDHKESEKCNDINCVYFKKCNPCQAIKTCDISAKRGC